VPTVVLDPPPVEFEELIERSSHLEHDVFDEVWDGVLHGERYEPVEASELVELGPAGLSRQIDWP
jgi:hypothetical protein